MDVEQFIAAADAAVAAQPDQPDELIARCRTAAALYGGELLAGDTDEWLLARREQLASRYRDVLRRLATALIDSGRAEAATGVAHDLVHADPLDELAHRLPAPAGWPTRCGSWAATTRRERRAATRSSWPSGSVTR